MSNVAGMVDKYGQPLADYEVRAIERNDWDDRDNIAYILGFGREYFGMREVQAVACDTCGGLFNQITQLMVRHRRLCGWDNGASAVKP